MQAGALGWGAGHLCYFNASLGMFMSARSTGEGGVTGGMDIQKGRLMEENGDSSPSICLAEIKSYFPSDLKPEELNISHNTAQKCT